MMKTNYLTVMVLGLLTALSGCQAEDDAPHTPQGTIPIGFSSDVPETRATKEYGSAADLTDIGVFAYFTNGTFSEGSSTPNFMYNQKVERQADGSWIYSPVRFWPGNTTDKISFFAYAPYVDEAASGGSNPSFQGKTAAGYPQLTYTVLAAEADQTDLLAAVPLTNRTAPAGEQVKFKLKHALTKVNVGIKSEVGITVTALSVNNVPATATLTFTDSGFDWGSYTGTKTVNATLAGGGTAVTANAADAQSLATFFVLPQKASATLYITYTQAGTPSMQFTKTDIALPATPTAWEQGMSVGYTLHVKKDGKVTATVGQEWTSESGGEMSGNEKGIASPTDWVAFTKLWNAKGLPMMPDGITPDYSLYEDYGWYETDGTNRVFTIKLTASFVLTGVASGELYVPVGTDTHPLTLPIDGQGWQISIDLQQWFDVMANICGQSPETFGDNTSSYWFNYSTPIEMWDTINSQLSKVNKPLTNFNISGGGWQVIFFSSSDNRDEWVCCAEWNTAPLRCTLWAWDKSIKNNQRVLRPFFAF